MCSLFCEEAFFHFEGSNGDDKFIFYKDLRITISLLFIYDRISAKNRVILIC